MIIECHPPPQKLIFSFPPVQFDMGHGFTWVPGSRSGSWVLVLQAAVTNNHKQLKLEPSLGSRHSTYPIIRWLKVLKFSICVTGNEYSTRLAFEACQLTERHRKYTRYIQHRFRNVSFASRRMSLFGSFSSRRTSKDSKPRTAYKSNARQ